MIFGIKNYFAQTIQKDKVQHFVAGALISNYASSMDMYFSENKREAFIVGSSFGIVAGVTKECIDLTGRGNPDMRDFVWTAVGSVVGNMKFVYVFKEPKKEEPQY